ncbi:MAG: four-carbon acid sugar kinase family protein [Paracoccaceae bacterium]
MAEAEQLHLSSPPLRLAIIADDLTGALDAAAPFADRGLRVRVATAPQGLEQALAGAGVLAVSTRSREIGSEAAARVVAGVLAALPPGTRLFKKIDSRLKGPIAAELAAFAAGPVLAVPALPEFGRIVRDGAVQGWGVDRPIPVADCLGRPALVPDVETPAQMQAALAGAGDALIVGARGAAVALAARMASGAPGLPELSLPLVIAVGSTDPITLAQVQALVGALPRLRHLPAPDGLAPTAAPAPGVTLLQATPGSGAPPPQVAKTLAQSLIPLARGAGTLVLTGGATAEAALDALGVTVLDLHGDLQPGLPLSSGGGWTIVTKSGGFGDAEALVRLARKAGA